MGEKSQSPVKILSRLMETYPPLEACRSAITAAFAVFCTGYRQGGKLLCCGNGGSAADCEHIAGELMKGFLLGRPLPDERRTALEALGEEGKALAQGLQGALPCVALTGHPALSTAFANDVDPFMIYAQQVMGLGLPGDMLLTISTSGNARNCALAVIAAKALGLPTIGLTGRKGGRLAQLCDVTIRVPAEETYQVQEYHLPVYHALCAMLEAEFFGDFEMSEVPLTL